MPPRTTREMLEVTEEFSGTIVEEGLIDEPQYNPDGTQQLNDDGTPKVKVVKGDVRVPVNLHKGSIYESNHRYVKLWPQFFQPVRATQEP